MTTDSQDQIALNLSENEALEAVCSIQPQNIFDFGLKLGVNHNTITAFQVQCTNDMKGWLRDILNERLRQEPRLTWHDIVTALKSPSVSEDRLASQIESQYMTHSQPPSSVPQQERSQLSSVPRQEGTQLSPVPQQEGTQPSLVPQQKRRQLPLVPQQKRHQLPLVPQQKRRQLPLVPQQKRYLQLPLLKQEGTQLSSVPQQKRGQRPSVPHPPVDHSHHQPLHTLAHQSHYVQLHPSSHYTHYSTIDPPTQYTSPQPPTNHQPSTSDPCHYQPPIQPPLVVVSPDPTHSGNDSVLERAGSPAATLQPSVQPHLEPCPVSSPDHHIETAPVTQHLAPADPHHQRSVSGWSSSPLQSSPHSQSSAKMTTTTIDLPRPECGDAVSNQSRIVEHVINRHTNDLTRTIGNDLPSFSNKFIELGFISRDAYNDIKTQRGVGNREKGSQLLNLVIDHFQRSHYKKNCFDKFVGVFSSEAAYENLATRMTEALNTGMAEGCISHTPSSPTSHAAHLPPHVLSFINYVKTMYRESKVERQPSVVKWPPTPSKVYINLVCIDRHSVSGRSREYQEVTQAMVRDGNVDAIVNVPKGPIDFSEIARNISIPNRDTSDKEQENKRRLIVVEGAPGVGKSTFAWEFCRRWERGEIAQQYQFVVLLRLREERISNAKSLKHLIYHPSKKVCRTVIKELKDKLGVNVLFILEGFDELPDIARSGGSVFMDLIAGKLLPLATVLVTSRPWATQEIRIWFGHRIYQHIEILGFTGRQITEYIESTLPQDKAIDLKAYLKSHPQIRAGMYIPLNSVIVVAVYEENQASGCAMPTTLTALYISLTLTLQLRYLHGHPEYGAGFKPLKALNDLPQLVNDKFNEVCKLAYSGTVGTRHQVQLIFRGLPSDFDDLGFMDSVTELYVTRGAVSSHNFLHLTFQEFFAALQISSMSPEEQVEHFKRHKEGRLKVVLKFLAGLNKLNCFSIEEIAENFLKTPPRHKGSRYLVSCDAAVSIDIVQWLFEAQSVDVIEHVLGQKTIEFDLSSGMLPLDYYSLGYCISHSQCHWVLNLREEGIDKTRAKMLSAGTGSRSEARGRVLELGGNWSHDDQVLSISTNCLNMLFTEWRDILHLQQLSLTLPESCDHITWPDLSALRVLKLRIIGETNWKLNTLLPHLSLESLTIAPGSHTTSQLVYEDCVAIGNHITSTATLKELCLLSRMVNEDEAVIYMRISFVETITAALTNNRSLPLERLELECKCAFNATAEEHLAQFITNTITLKYLSIKKGKFDRWEAITAALVSNQSLPLERLELECEYTFTPVAGGSLAQFIANATTLKYLSIKNAGFDRVETITAALASNQSLPLERLEFECVCTFTGTAGDTLAQFFRHTTTLKDAYFSIQRCTLSAHALLALLGAIHHNSILRTDLANFTLTVNRDKEAKALAQLLVEYPVLMRKCIGVNMSNKRISNARAVALTQARHYNSILTLLNLSKSSISDAGAVALTQALHHNSTLTELNLCKNSISDAGAEALAQALRHNSTLMQLDLSNNSISDAGVVALAQALHHNSTLTKLDLSNNSVSDTGAVAVAQALHHNSTLTILKLYGNYCIGEKGTHRLIQALTVNTSISGSGGLSLPAICKEYTKKWPLLHAVKDRITFH